MAKRSMRRSCLLTRDWTRRGPGRSACPPAAAHTCASARGGILPSMARGAPRAGGVQARSWLPQRQTPRRVGTILRAGPAGPAGGVRGGARRSAAGIRPSSYSPVRGGQHPRGRRRAPTRSTSRTAKGPARSPRRTNNRRAHVWSQRRHPKGARQEPSLGQTTAAHPAA